MIFLCANRCHIPSLAETSLCGESASDTKLVTHVGGTIILGCSPHDLAAVPHFREWQKGHCNDVFSRKGCLVAQRISRILGTPSIQREWSDHPFSPQLLGLPLISGISRNRPFWKDTFFRRRFSDPDTCCLHRTILALKVFLTFSLQSLGVNTLAGIWAMAISADPGLADLRKPPAINRSSPALQET